MKISSSTYDRIVSSNGFDLIMSLVKKFLDVCLKNLVTSPHVTHATIINGLKLLPWLTLIFAHIYLTTIFFCHMLV